MSDELSLSHSARSTLTKCPRLYKYQYIERITPKAEAKPLRMGSAYSDGLEHWTTDAVEDFYGERLLNATHANEMAWLTEELYVVRALVATYIERTEKHEREIEFSFDDGDNGFIDGRVDDTTIIENKCKGRFTAVDVDALRMDSQCTGYIRAQSILAGVDPEDIVLYYDVALKPLIRQKQSESHGEFLSRLEQVIYEDPDKYHQRHEVTRSQHQIDEYEYNLIDAEVIVKDRTQRLAWPRNTQACTLYGKCSMFEVCHAPPEDRAKLIKENYKEKEQRG